MEIKANKLTDTYTLNNNVQIPVIGFGTWQSADGEEAYNAVKWALEAGYRHIDTAAAYGNEESVGQAIKDSGIKREDLFVTTKLWNYQRDNYENSLRGFHDSITRLELDYVDLYLIHWPEPIEYRDHWQSLNADSWRAMEKIYKDGKTRAIGVSNFREKHIDELMKTAEIAPMVNQIFLNPGDQEKDLVTYNKNHNILTEAYSPLGTGNLLDNPELKKLADKHGVDVAQILIRWNLEKGYLPLPKSTHQKYIESNKKVFSFQLDYDDHKTLDALDGQGKQHTDPHEHNFQKVVPFLNN
ncbi:2,5-diketo-D-gluconic acid reductase [Oenococcus oeni]|uniref:Glyoxal reductase n=2 Tax=Oenococcus oeni TaxID=1247 RepID=A0AAQ2ZGT5_OENOE|nr:aldo/keto reductase [Oenococcus oeni]OIL40044.1 2,5-diketo-D-gluconic acid reductase [Oenococcus oeni]OIM26756.1 2,5-diketo-D-gluconic acid reductase [Oenococcus oeni]OLQ41745.1 2,5-diketo-D-gluconic acid reductase [Oenococcus oeni]VDB99417.1 Glyoxal reductase [Oenococcus oeni]